MVHRLPPLNGLRSFEAAARHLSFTRAAQELGVTQAAVSWQIRQLEEQLGRPLFLRRTRRLELTPAGAELLAAVTEAFDRLGAALARLAERTDDRVLAITTLPTFAAQWLVPRLGQFQMRHPELAVRLEAAAGMSDLQREFDLAIRSGDGRWPGLVAERLVDFRLTPAVSPALLAQSPPLTQPRDLLTLPFVDAQHPDDQVWWRDWFRLAGLSVQALPNGPQYDLHAMTGHAAIGGQGVALLCPDMFAADIAAGRLVLPFPTLFLDTGRSYWLAYAERRRNEAKIQAFRTWVLGQVAGKECA